MTNKEDKKFEIGPGIYFITKNRRYSLVLETPMGEEIMCWDYEEIMKDPTSWFASLKAVALATQSGPTIAFEWVKSRLAKLQTSAGDMICNVCNTKFVPADIHPYIFNAELNGKKFHDLQCSLTCNQKRKLQVYTEEFGAEFLKHWNERFAKQSIGVKS